MPATWYENWERRLSPVGFALFWALCMQLGSFCFYSYQFWMPPSYRLTKTYLQLCHNPATHTYLEETWVRHRMLGPGISYLLHLPDAVATLLPIFGITLLLFLSHTLLRRHTNLKNTMLGLALLATTLAVSTCHIWLGFQDALAAAALVGMLLVPHPVLSAGILALGMLADERCAAALPLVLLWHHLETTEHAWRKTILRGLSWTVVIAVWASYFWWMMQNMVLPDMKMTLEEFRAYIYHEGLFSRQISVIPAAAYFTLRAGWLLPMLLVAVWWRKKPQMAVLYCMATGICIVQGCLVADLSRAMAIVFVALLLALVYLHREADTRFADWLHIALLFNILTPAYQIVGKDMSLNWPLPIALLRWWLG